MYLKKRELGPQAFQAFDVGLGLGRAFQKTCPNLGPRASGQARTHLYHHHHYQEYNHNNHNNNHHYHVCVHH